MVYVEHKLNVQIFKYMAKYYNHNPKVEMWYKKH